MRKTTLWSSLGAAALLAASSFSASAQTTPVFVTPPEGSSEVTQAEMRAIKYYYDREKGFQYVCGAQNPTAAQKETYRTQITLTDGGGNVVYTCQNFSAVKTANSKQSVISYSDPLLTVDDKNYIVLDFGEVAPGEYTLNVPKNFVNVFNGTFPAIEKTLTVTASVAPSNPMENYDLRPISGSAVYDLSSVSLTFPSDLYVEYTGNSEKQATLMNTATSEIFKFTTATYPNGNNAPQLNLPEGTVLDPGTYTLAIPEGALFIWSDEGEKISAPLIEATYVVKALPFSGYSFTPETIQLEEGQETFRIMLNFPNIDGEGYSRNDEIHEWSEIVLSDGTNTYPLANYNVWSTGVYLLFNSADVAGGEYQLTIPEGFFKTNSGVSSPAMTGTFVIEAPEVNPLEVYALDPASGEKIEAPRTGWPYVFTVSFPEIGDNTLEAIDESAFAEIYLTNGTDNINAFNVEMSSDNKSFDVGFESGIVGQYTLVIPAGFCKTANGDLSPEIRGEYTFVAPLPEFESQDPAYNVENPTISEMRLNYSAAVEFKADAAPMAVLNYETDADTGMTATFSALENEGKTVVVKFSETALEDGEYYFMVPEGAIYAAGDPEAVLDQETFTFLIKAPVKPAYDGQYPAEGEGVVGLTEVKQFFTAPVAIADGAQTEFVLFNNTAYENNEDDYTNGTANVSISEDGLTAIFTLNPVKELVAADYKVIVPKGVFVSATDPSYQLGALVLRFTVAPAPVNPMTIFTVDPEDNSEVTELSEVVLNFTELGDQGFYGDYKGIVFKNTETGEEWSTIVNNKYNDWHYCSIIARNSDYTQATITTPGSYELIIPAGSLYDYEHQENKCEEIVLHYTIPEPPANPFAEYGVMPEDQVVREISTVTLSFYGYNFGTVVDMNSEKKAVLVNKETNEEYVANVAFGEFFGNLDYNTVKLTFDPAITVLGDYTLTVEAGLLSLNGAESLEITKDFTVAEIPSAFSGWTLDPAPGKEVSSLEKLTLTFPNVGSSMLDVYMGDITLTLKGTETVIAPSMVAKAYDPVAEEDINGVFEITFDPAVTAAGTYVLNIPAGKFMNWSDTGDVCPEINVEYVIAANPFGTYTLTPASMEEGLKEVSTVEVLFPAISAEETITYDEADVEKIGMRNVDTDQVIPAIAIEQTDTENGKLLTIRFAKSATDAKHILTIPAGILKLGDATNFMIEAIYDIEASGVALLVGENGTADVYDLNGRVILLNADADALRQLEGGLYIINGKKVVIRK